VGGLLLGSEDWVSEEEELKSDRWNFFLYFFSFSFFVSSFFFHFFFEWILPEGKGGYHSLRLILEVRKKERKK